MINKHYQASARRHYALLLLASTLLLSACGGGSSSSSSGGAGGGFSSSGASSTLVLDVSRIDGVAALIETNSPDFEKSHFLAKAVRLVFSSAWANHIRVLLNGTDFGRTSDNESFMIAVTAGNYEVTFVADDALVGSCSTSVSVGNDQIIYWDNIDIMNPGDRCKVTYNTRVENVSDDLISGGDNSPNGKTLVCHKNKNTIAVSFNAVSAHLAHEDKTGPCASNISANDTNSSDDGNSADDAESDDDSNGNGNKPGKPDKPGKPGKPGKPT